MELLPCPFCGSNVISNFDDLPVIWCCNCMAQAPKEYWNTRASGWVSCKDENKKFGGEKLTYRKENLVGFEIRPIFEYECDHEFDKDNLLTSNPAKYRCNKCGITKFAKDI